METVEERNAKEIEEANFIRDSIKKSFKSMDCYCLPFPIDNGLKGMNYEETLRNLDQINFNELRNDFRNGINELCETMFRNICPKTILTVPLSASAFSKYIEVVVKQLNENEKNLDGSNDLTRPVLEIFQSKICEYEGNKNKNKLTGG